jgi:2-polyprenyl-3-methyl-5-hydroxy-6-metoxy-1,4-benzoquinol methylase
MILKLIDLLRLIKSKIAIGLRKLEQNFSPKFQNIDGKGERVDIYYHPQKIELNKLPFNEKAHFWRYDFAAKIVDKTDICGDFACGSGYGSAMLAYQATQVIGGDYNYSVIEEVKKRYKPLSNLGFIQIDLTQLNYHQYFDKIISFETLEHFKNDDLKLVLNNFYQALKPQGKLILSTPYQEIPPNNDRISFHHQFMLDESQINAWLINAGFTKVQFYYQNCGTFMVKNQLEKYIFLITIAEKP